jgi:hypothetical protein
MPIHHATPPPSAKDKAYQNFIGKIGYLKLNAF